MKTENVSRSFSRIALAPLALVFLLLAGCLEKTLVWSPDGQRAAVLVKDGLRLCDAEGKLTPVLAPDVYRAAWLGDSQQLVVARKHVAATWVEVAKAAGPDRAAALIAQAEAVWQKVQTGASWDSVHSFFHDNGAAVMRIYLRERYGSAIRPTLSAEGWAQFEKQNAEVHELLMARLDGDKLVMGTQLSETLGEIKEIRLAPSGQTVAFTYETKTGKDDLLRLQLARVNGSGATPVAERVAMFPDWTTDGRALVYVQATGGETKDDLRLGTLVRREVLDASGKIAVQDEVKYLAGWIFSASARVRCLRDGRILFNAAEISLPIAAADYGEQREQLFALDPARQATLVRMIPRKREENLPQSLAFYEPSPDERQVLLGWFDGTVALLTLATGEVDEVQKGVKDDGLQGQPVWRTNGEFSYTRRSKAPDGQKPVRDAEVVLRRADKSETVLSTSWPDELVRHLVGGKNK
ncbi:MAG: hypothetical protein HZA31_04230 [Opitutae bacterium]|nr:hypothetical protein [Opitutae bacterium]